MRRVATTLRLSIFGALVVTAWMMLSSVNAQAFAVYNCCGDSLCGALLALNACPSNDDAQCLTQQYPHCCSDACNSQSGG